jgi:hypothetical protein
MESFLLSLRRHLIYYHCMTIKDKQKVKERMKVMGVSRRWLAEECGYSYFSIRDALAPNGKKTCRRLHDAIERALSKGLRPL